MDFIQRIRSFFWKSALSFPKGDLIGREGKVVATIGPWTRGSVEVEYYGRKVIIPASSSGCLGHGLLVEVIEQRGDLLVVKKGRQDWRDQRAE